MTEPIRLVVCDIDGTLARDDKTVSDGNVAAVRRLIDAGRQFTLISARPPSGMLWIAARLGLTGPFGAFNGGTILSRHGGPVETHRLPRALAEQALALIDQPRVIVWLFSDGIWHTRTMEEVHTPREIKSAGQQPTIIDDLAALLDTVDKLVAVSDDRDTLDALERQVEAAMGDAATVVRSQIYYLDITARRANKGDGIATLAGVMGVPLDRTAAFGDQHNDLAMFARAGLSVAMGQAPADVRAQADTVSRTNDADGVAYAIDTFILGQDT